ncbi:hypothetical protein PF002_g24851 [Phytophthora fragariae]|uniref:Uncharacterized protein n=1 Tax=Phytophthora fragariae TaxID=53985 RepID=A0A6A3X136_9STRA|nr:hypothetical protein PF002_g24851 [Phytophthora fragariae]
MEKWDFLEPWRVVLVRDRTTTEFAGESSFITRIRATLAANSDIAESVQVSISFAEKYPSSKKTICLKLPIDETNRREASRLRQLREAMELFTLLSVVNNRAFTELTASATEPQPAKTGEHRIQLPSWSLQLVGTLSPNAVSAVQSQVTWGALLGFPEDPWGYSPEFREAVARLEAMGLDESVKKENGFVVSKACRCRALYTTADGEWVNVVVPGYGTGKAKIGGGTRFIPDSVTPQLREKRLSGALELNDHK